MGGKEKMTCDNSEFYDCEDCDWQEKCCRECDSKSQCENACNIQKLINGWGNKPTSELVEELDNKFDNLFLSLVADRLEKQEKELKQRRESDLRPATKFENLDIEECVCNKVLEEFFEVYAACRDGNNVNLAEELVDLQMVCETSLWRLGLDENQRMEARKAVIKKNQERGYYIAKGD